jgi:hypothetical protein
MAMTTCKECRQAVSDEAPTCPKCGTTDPGEGGAERDARRKADSAAGERQVWLGCGGFVLVMALLLGGGALYSYVTAVELDEPARSACSSAELAALQTRAGTGTPVQVGVRRIEAVTSALESEAEGLREAAGGGSLNPDTVNSDYLGVLAWCEENGP